MKMLYLRATKWSAACLRSHSHLPIAFKGIYTVNEIKLRQIKVTPPSKNIKFRWISTEYLGVIMLYVKSVIGLNQGLIQ